MAKPMEENGIHRAHTWEIALYACNNTSTNIYMMLVSYISYYLIGIVGVLSVVAGSVVTVMRIWDGVTDPFVGFVVDKTNGKFGKNRPFILLGNLLLFATTFTMFHSLPRLAVGLRFAVFILLYMVYIIGYTSQCVVTKSAQTCLTNDPKQRPVFAMFDAVYTVIALSLIIPVYVTNTLYTRYTLNTAQHAEKIQALIAQNPNLANLLVQKDGTQVLSAYYNPEMFTHMQLVFGIASFILAVLAIIGLWRKDNSRYFGTGKPEKIYLRDYADTLLHNRGIQMLVISASSDKLTLSTTGNAAVMMCLFGVICGNYTGLFAANSQLCALPNMVFAVLAMNFIARKLGQKKALLFGTWGGILSAGLLLLLFVAGDPSSAVLPAFSLTDPASWANLFRGSCWSLFGALFVVLYILLKGSASVASSIVIPMTADCADYEVYRTGKYLPGLMGTLFSFVDKMISSLASTIVSVAYAAIGFTAALPTAESPYSTGIFWVTMALFLGMPVLGWVLNLIAMHFYPLTKEKMAQIQAEIARIKAGAAKSQGAAPNK